MRYKIEDIKNNKIVINCKSKEQAHKIMDAWNLHEVMPRHSFQNATNFSIRYAGQRDLSWVNENETKNYFQKNYQIEKTIEFSEIDFEEKTLIESLIIW